MKRTVEQARAWFQECFYYGHDWQNHVCMRCGEVSPFKPGENPDPFVELKQQRDASDYPPWDDRSCS